MTPQKIALLTDSCADLSPQLAAENQVFVVPLRILCKDGEYRDGVDIHAADIYARLRSGELPQTSLPAAQDISDAFDAIAAAGYDGVIALMLSGGLSGTYNMVRLLAEERRDLTIRVYDSVSGSLGTGMMILQLAEELRQGMDWQTLTERRVPWLIQNTFPFFSVDTLEYLQKGGRIGKVTAMAGTMLQIKPLITFAADGQLQSIAKVRGRNLVIRKLIELVTPVPQRRGAVQSGGGQRRRSGGDGDSAGQAHHRPAKLRPHLERRAGWYVERLHRRRRAGSRGTETGIEREDKGSETKGPGRPNGPGSSQNISYLFYSSMLMKRGSPAAKAAGLLF